MIAPYLKKLLSENLKTAMRGNQRTELHSDYLRESTAYADIGEAGALIKDIFCKIKDIPGWFNVDDCGHFFLILSYQSLMGVKGDILEIGSYHGRSTALMARCLRPEERIVVCDAFQSDTRDSYTNKPSPSDLISNIQSLSPDINKNRIFIHNCLSSNLRLNPSEMFRFIHIDGGHSAEQAYFDLKLCSKHLIPKGIVVMDDYQHKHFPGVAEGTDRFLLESCEFAILADLNRHGALGRKLYIIKKS